MYTPHRSQFDVVKAVRFPQADASSSNPDRRKNDLAWWAWSMALVAVVTVIVAATMLVLHGGLMVASVSGDGFTFADPSRM